MAEPAAEEAASKQRIINYMNNGHQDSLIRYLEHFCHLSSFSARHAQLVDVTFDCLTLKTSGGTSFQIPIAPAMDSWADARSRVVAMDDEASASLKRSNITVKKYARPTGFMAIVFTAVVSTLAVYSKRSNFQAGSLPYDNVWVYTPGFAQWSCKIQPVILYMMIIIHASEAVYMILGRLRKHTVPTFSKLWWKWALSTFFEGVGAFIRFDGIVKEEENKKEKVKR